MYLEFNPNINPAYSSRIAHEREPVLARLPLAPVNASPVPRLTSLYHGSEAGDYGDRGYPGNCGGKLIRDLLLYFQPRNVFDPMTGSGTCRDVCQELKVEHVSTDLRQGFDACDPTHYQAHWRFDFIWLHPPYWRIKRYNNDPRCMSSAPTLERFLGMYRGLIAGCNGVLAPGGKLAILMGDCMDRDEGFVPLTYFTKQIAYGNRLRSHCIDIIRFSHGALGSRKTYRSSFIPMLHDHCMIFERDE